MKEVCLNCFPCSRFAASWVVDQLTEGMEEKLKDYTLHQLCTSKCKFIKAKEKQGRQHNNIKGRRERISQRLPNIACCHFSTAYVSTITGTAFAKELNLMMVELTTLIMHDNVEQACLLSDI